MPDVYELFEYWETFPPAHECMRLAWLKVEERSNSARPGRQRPVDENSDSGDVGAFMAMPHVSGGWVGPPAFRVEDVMRMAEEAKANVKH